MQVAGELAEDSSDYYSEDLAELKGVQGVQDLSVEALPFLKMAGQKKCWLLPYLGRSWPQELRGKSYNLSAGHFKTTLFTSIFFSFTAAFLSSFSSIFLYTILMTAKHTRITRANWEPISKVHIMIACTIITMESSATKY